MKSGLNILKLSSLLLIMLMPLFGKAQLANATASIDTNNVLIGDHIKLTYKATFPVKANVILPFIGDTLTKNIDVISRSKIDTMLSTDKRNVSYSQTINITSFDSGSIVVPTLLFTYKMPGDTTRLFVSTTPILLNINTIPVDTTKAIKDIKAPLKEPITLREIIIIGSIILGALLIILIAIYVIRKLRRKEAIINISLKPKVPAHEKALNELSKLRAEKLWQAGKVKEFHSILTDIVRIYIEERFDTIAMEMTTHEIITSLGLKNIGQAELLKNLEKILTVADMVKFAKYNPLPDEHDNSLNLAVGFVERTVPVKTETDKENQVTIPEDTNETKTE